jgi:hypothetical protein
VSKLIEFLEKMGQDASLRHATPAKLVEALMRSDLNDSEREAILRKDQRLLEAMLDARANVCCMVAKPMREEPDEAEEEKEETEKKDDKPKSVKPQAAARRVA